MAYDQNSKTVRRVRFTIFVGGHAPHRPKQLPVRPISASYVGTYNNFKSTHCKLSITDTASQECGQKPKFDDGVRMYDYCGKKCAQNARVRGGASASLVDDGMCKVRLRRYLVLHLCAKIKSQGCVVFLSSAKVARGSRTAHGRSHSAARLVPRGHARFVVHTGLHRRRYSLR